MDPPGGWLPTMRVGESFRLFASRRSAAMRTGPARGRTGNFHEAGFYGSDAEFLSLIVPFVTDGATAGEPVVLGDDTRKCELLRAELPQPDTVAFLGDGSLYATPAGAIEAYR